MTHNNEQHRTFIKKKFEEGYSAKAISMLLQSAFKIDLSRNAVGGIIDRMGLKRSSSRVKSYFTTAQRRSSAPQQIPNIPTKEPAAVGPLNDFPSAGKCKFTHDDPSKHNFRMCGHKTSGIEDPWCDYHKSRVFSAAHRAA